MSVSGGPDIVEDGLVLILDTANGESFRGEPTENLITNNPLPISTDSYGISGGAGNAFYDENEKAVRWIRTSYETWGAYYQNNSLNNYLFDTNSSYTMTFEWKFGPTHTAGTTHNFQIVQGNGLNVIMGNHNLLSNSVLQSNGWYKFTRTQIPNNAGVSVTGQVPGVRLIVGNQGSNVTDIYWRNLQYEKKPYATPFVNGTRGTTVATGGGWGDLTGNDNHGELINGPTYNSSNLGSLVFDGVNDYASFTNPISHTGPYTILLWVKPNVALVAGGSGANRPTGSNRKTPIVGPGPIWNPGIWLTSDYIRSHSDTQYVDSAINWTTTAWNMIGMTFDGTNIKNILGGNILPNTHTTSYGPAETSTLYVGSEVSGGSGQNWNGIIGPILIYNKVLTAPEILQNYNATKGRFGL
jgi:hypothetical protein